MLDGGGLGFGLADVIGDSTSGGGPLLTVLQSVAASLLTVLHSVAAHC